MAVHPDVSTMAVEGIDEHMQAAAICVQTKKPDGGCLGYAATLLLFCVVNALGTFLRDDTVNIDGKAQKVSKGEPFRVLNHTIFGLNLTGAEIKVLEKSYRNALAHNGIIEPGACLVQVLGTNGTRPFGFASNKIQVIEVNSFYQVVMHAWRQLDRSRLQSWAIRRAKEQPGNRVSFIAE